jgi:hypothetical protein
VLLMIASRKQKRQLEAGVGQRFAVGQARAGLTIAGGASSSASHGSLRMAIINLHESVGIGFIMRVIVTESATNVNARPLAL